MSKAISSSVRPDQRKPGELRPVTFELGVAPAATGSALVRFGRTQVICAATVEESVPRWMREQKVAGGWLSAEYSLLPYSTHQRTSREVNAGRVGGRTQEIQRLVGRALRAVTDLEKLGARTIWVDCDVLQADGGTRTAAITGAMVALADALAWLAHNGKIKTWPLKNRVAAVSVGLVKGQNLLDLDYLEDQAAEVDCNLVMTDDGRLVEIQGTAEGEPCPRDIWDALLELGTRGIGMMFEHQARAMVPALEAKKLFPLA